MTKRKRKPKYRYCTPPAHLPSEAEIKAACLSIQAGWDRVTEHQRRGLNQDEEDVGLDRPGKLATTPPVSTAGLPWQLREMLAGWK